jgi:hypothetical protein
MARKSGNRTKYTARNISGGKGIPPVTFKSIFTVGIPAAIVLIGITLLITVVGNGLYFALVY